MEELNAVDHLDNVLEEGTEFDISEFLSEGFSVWKKYLGGYIGFTIIIMVISMIANIIPFVGPVANWILVSPCLSLGAYLVSDEVHRNGAAEFSDFFNGFKFAQEIVIAQLLIGLAFAGISLTLGFNFLTSFSAENILSGEFQNFQPSWWTFIPILVMIYGGILILYVNCFIGFYHLKAIEAITYSVKFVNRHWFAVFAYVIVIGLIAISGIIGLIVGIFITLNIVYPMTYVSFRGLTRLDEFQEEMVEEEVFS